MNLEKSNINIIVPNKDEIPPWRLLQSKLGQWKSLHKDGVSIDPGLAPEKMYSKEELAKIQLAIRGTQAMGDPSVDKSEVHKLDGIAHTTD